MTAFLIILAVLAVILIAVLSLSATVTLVYDKGWHTKVQVLFIEKDIELSKILSFILFPEKKAQQVSESGKEKRANKKNNGDEKAEKTEKNPTPASPELPPDGKPETGKSASAEKEQPQQARNKPAKSNPIKNLWDKEGIVGIMSLLTNILDTANSAVITLIRGLHIYSLYVMILVGGPDADMIARAYGTLCKYYYPLKGLILANMKVDQYDDYIQPDFIADRTETEFQLIGSINVALLLKVVLKAGFIFIKNLILNKKGE